MINLNRVYRCMICDAKITQAYAHWSYGVTCSKTCNDVRVTQIRSVNKWKEDREKVVQPGGTPTTGQGS